MPATDTQRCYGTQPLWRAAAAPPQHERQHPEGSGRLSIVCAHTQVAESDLMGADPASCAWCLAAPHAGASFVRCGRHGCNDQLRPMTQTTMPVRPSPHTHDCRHRPTDHHTRHNRCRASHSTPTGVVACRRQHCQRSQPPPRAQHCGHPWCPPLSPPQPAVATIGATDMATIITCVSAIDTSATLMTGIPDTPHLHAGGGSPRHHSGS